MQTTIYIRKENEEAWEALADKSAWVNHVLAGAIPSGQCKYGCKKGGKNEV